MKARSGFIPVFQHPEKKLIAPLGLCRRARLLLAAQVARLSLSSLVVL